MRLEFRIDWGYQYLYSRRHYHPQYFWDGSLSCDNGTIEHTYQLTYPVVFFGPGHSAIETELEKPEWESFTKRRISGVRFVTEVNENSVFHLRTMSFSTDFSAKELQEKGRLEYFIGPKYLGTCINIIRADYLWFRPEPMPGEHVFDADEIDLPVHTWQRMRLAYLAPGESVDFSIEVPESGKDVSETIMHLIAMGAPDYPAEKEYGVAGHVPMELCCDGEEVVSFTRYYRFHDYVLQIMEDDWERMPLTPGKHTISLTNKGERINVGINRISFRTVGHNHGELDVPEWMLREESLHGKVFAASEGFIEVQSGEKPISVECVKGWNEFVVQPDARNDLVISTVSDSKTVKVYDVAEEEHPIKVGYDMTCVPHDKFGIMDWLLDYTQSTRLGNYVSFRSFTERPQPVDRALIKRWGDYCRTHNIYVSACSDYEDGVLSAAAGEMFDNAGIHEFPYPCYARDPIEGEYSKDMKEAADRYMKYIGDEVDRIHEHNPAASFGDPSGACRYSYLAGMDYARAETMIGNTQTLLSQVRPAAESLSNGKWGAHIAMQHCYQPYHENHLGQYFLALLQPWMMGAEVIYEEDSLFVQFKEDRQTWDDYCTKGKRDMTRAFYRFAKTHPRKGRNVRRIAFLEGRYAAPFHGFICGSEQDPHYSVWGRFGSNEPAWGHAQPEKCRALLDVLMPGASTHPFRQKFEKRRFFFAGTPYGDFDCVPVEAKEDYLNGYSLLLNLGWNTCIPEDTEKLRRYVADGGVLLTGIPQFSEHLDREFLLDMEDLQLVNGGDLSELCGIRVKGRGEIFCGQWNCAGRANMTEPELSAMPSDSPDEDGPGYMADVELCGAEVVAWDSFSGLPLLVRKAYDKGCVYTFTIWGYPGHERFQRFAAAWVEQLAKVARGETYVEDDSGEIFWTIWKDDEGGTTVMLLNTDWFERGNLKDAVIVCNGRKYPVQVKERTAMIAEFHGDAYSITVHTL